MFDSEVNSLTTLEIYFGTLTSRTQKYCKMAKRLTSSNVNWGYIMETLWPEDLKRLVPLKTTHEKLLRAVAGKPTELPKIDWAFYKNRISVPGMVDSFQKAYESLKVPYPSDQGLLSSTEKENAEMIEFAKNQGNETVKEINTFKQKLEEMEKVMKYSEMTLEELFLARQDLKIDPDNPKFFPQNIPDPPNAKKPGDH